MFEGFLEVIVRRADHGDTLLRWRVVPVRVNPPGTELVNERVTPLVHSLRTPFSFFSRAVSHESRYVSPFISPKSTRVQLYPN